MIIPGQEGETYMYIEVENGVRVFVQDINPGKGSFPVLFVHGWPVNHKMFEYQYTVLPYYGFRCLGLDLRGFGRSDKPWHGYSYDRLADDLYAVLTQRPHYPYGLPVEQVNALIRQTHMDRPQMLNAFGQMFFNRNMRPGITSGVRGRRTKRYGSCYIRLVFLMKTQSAA
ncbi:MAG: alpha/beta hydrolase [Calditerricola sp.]|nr:alpha/beta hydrolase [Calditerricola sp.]